MTVEIGLVFAVVAVALYLFASQRLPLDVSALAILAALMTIPIVGDLAWLRDRGVDLPGAFPTIEEGLSGLSSPATVTVLAMFILSAGVQRAGVMHVLGKRVMPFVGNSELRMFMLTAGLVGITSGIVNNTAAVAVSIPFVLDLCRKLDLRASRLLMPLSFFGMLGGMLTVIGTSTNILAATILADTEEFGRSLGMFEFTQVGVIVLATGLVYFLVVGRFLLPAEDLGTQPDGRDEEFIVELEVPKDSEWLDESLADSQKAVNAGVTVIKVIRGAKPYRSRANDLVLGPGDILQVRGTIRNIADLVSSDQVHVLSGGEGGAATRQGRLVRVLVRNRLLFDNVRVRKVDFWLRYRARLVGLETPTILASRLAEERLRVGEIVLLEAHEEALPRLRRHPDLVLLSEFEDEFDTRRMWLAGGIVLAVVIGAAITPLPIVLTAVMGIVAMVGTGCVTKEDLYSGVSWDVIILLAGVIPLGVAMTKSGAAQWLGESLAGQASDWHPLVVLMVLYGFTTLLTELVSNNASVVILVPIAVTLSGQLEIDLLALVLTVMFAASTSFLSPVGYQTNAMVFGTGLYRFTDFAKVGGPLNLILMVVTSTAIWRIWVL